MERTKRENAHKLFMELLEKHARGKSEDECLYELLHRTSYIRGLLFRKAIAFVRHNPDYGALYAAEDVVQELSPIVVDLFRQAGDEMTEVRNYADILSHRCDNKLVDIKRKYLANKSEIERNTRPYEHGKLELKSIKHEAFGNYKRGEQRKPMPFNTSMDDVDNRLLIEQILADTRLDEQQRKLLECKYANPNATNAELAEMFGYNGKKAVERAFRAIGKILADYNEE